MPDEVVDDAPEVDPPVDPPVVVTEEDLVQATQAVLAARNVRRNAVAKAAGSKSTYDADHQAAVEANASMLIAVAELTDKIKAYSTPSDIIP